MPVVSESEFLQELLDRLSSLEFPVKSVSGPGRSGAIASVYASHILGVPFLPYGTDIPEKLRPHLIVDTAVQSGKTLRKAMKRAKTVYSVAVFKEPPRVKFWYEMLIGSPSAFEPYILKEKWRCPECDSTFERGTEILAAIVRGRVKKRVCSIECRLVFDDRFWQHIADIREGKMNV